MYNLRHQFNMRPTGQLYSSFFQLGIKLWNKLPDALKLGNLSEGSYKNRLYGFLNISRLPLCPRSVIDRKSEILLNRIVLDFSQLRSDLFKHNIIDNNKCTCGWVENFRHFLLECPNFNPQRAILLQSLFTNNIIPLHRVQHPNAKSIMEIITDILKKPSSPLLNSLRLPLQLYIKNSGRFP